MRISSTCQPDGGGEDLAGQFAVLIGGLGINPGADTLPFSSLTMAGLAGAGQGGEAFDDLGPGHAAGDEQDRSGHFGFGL